MVDLSEEFIFERGKDSKQKAIESERQSRVLTVFYFDAKDIPDTPAEPDTVEPDYDDSQVTIIPLEEIVRNLCFIAEDFSPKPQQCRLPRLIQMPS